MYLSVALFGQASWNICVPVGPRKMSIGVLLREVGPRKMGIGVCKGWRACSSLAHATKKKR